MLRERFLPIRPKNVRTARGGAGAGDEDSLRGIYYTIDIRHGTFFWPCVTFTWSKFSAYVLGNDEGIYMYELIYEV